jgi:hypothetical protein
MMGQVLVAVLALAVLTGAAHAHCNLAEYLFGEQGQTARHLNEEAFGDEFRRPAL